MAKYKRTSDEDMKLLKQIGDRATFIRNIENESYLFSAIRYVHQNPLKPGIGTVEGYQWSSYREYLEEDRKIADTLEILSSISNSREKALREFARFNHELTEETFLDIGEEKEISQNNVYEYVGRYLEEKGLRTEDLKGVANKSAREELIKLLIEKSNLSLRGIAAALGLNREMIRRTFVSRDLSP